MIAPPPDAVARFRDDVVRLVPQAADTTIAVAVSGGPDSMAMLALALAAFPGRVTAATVDHGLRDGSAVEAAMVARWCAGAGVPHETLKPKRGWWPKSVQADARDVRYALLGDWALGAGATGLLTAHHADDQAETFLMRAARGSGVAGLAGIRSAWTWEHHRWRRGYPRGGVVAVADVDSVTVARPLLAWTRAELAAVAAGLPTVQDPSNADDRFDRVRMRRLLAAETPFDARALAASAAACAEADAALSATLAVLRRERMRESAVDARTYDMAELPRELRRRFVREAIGYVRDVGGIVEGRWSDGANVEAMLDSLYAGGKATLAGVVGQASGDIWRFTAAPPRRRPLRSS